MKNIFIRRHNKKKIIEVLFKNYFYELLFKDGSEKFYISPLRYAKVEQRLNRDKSKMTLKFVIKKHNNSNAMSATYDYKHICSVIDIVAKIPQNVMIELIENWSLKDLPEHLKVDLILKSKLSTNSDIENLVWIFNADRELVDNLDKINNMKQLSENIVLDTKKIKIFTIPINEYTLETKELLVKIESLENNGSILSESNKRKIELYNEEISCILKSIKNNLSEENDCLIKNTINRINKSFKKIIEEMENDSCIDLNARLTALNQKLLLNGD